MEAETLPLAASPESGGSGERVTLVSLGELAAIPGTPSEPTLRRLIEENEDFPLVSRGSNGSAYEIPLERAISWLRARREAEEEAARRRSNELKQYGLALLGEGAASAATSAASGVSPADQKALLEAEVLAIKVARERGDLVRKAEVEAKAGELAAGLRRRFRELPNKLAKRVDLSREALAELTRLVDQTLEDVAADWEALGAASSVPDDPAD